MIAFSAKRGALIALFVNLLGACAKPAAIEGTCTANGMGEISCEFHNSGESEGSQCVYVVLKQNESSEQMVSREICSGLIRPGDLIQRETSGGFEKRPADFCSGGYLSDWTDNCSLSTTRDLEEAWKATDAKE